MSNKSSQQRYPTFAEVKAAALSRIEQVLGRWLPAYKLVDGGTEYTAPNPTRTDSSAGSFKISKAKGTWCDFATGDKGGDLIDLVVYIDGSDKKTAKNALADFLGLTAGTYIPPQTQVKSEKPDEWLALQPIPSEAMKKPPMKHYKHGAPSKLWTYKDQQGQPLMLLYRFDLKPDANGKRRKEFTPLTFCKNSKSGITDWRWKGLAQPRPLLNLDQLAAKPAAPVLLCEGEKAADAAAVLMPSHVVTCWPNGSNAWNKADFAPLKNRAVTLWPDNDDAGLVCMAEIAKHLHELGAAKVHTVALDCFMQTPTEQAGKPAFSEGGEWPKGADAADALEMGWTDKHIELLSEKGLFAQLTPSAEPASKPAAKSAAKPRVSRAKTQEQAPLETYQFRADGVYIWNAKSEEFLHICSPLKILAFTRDDKGNNWGLLVELIDPDGVQKRWNIPARCMAGDFQREIVGPLSDIGLRLAPSRRARDSRNDLQSYLQAYQGAERARLVTRLGWHGEAYLLPDKQLGANTEQLHFYEDGAKMPPINQAGTLEQWQQNIGALCAGNHRLGFVVSVALAGPLLNLLGDESGGFHLYGDSSGGKTTHLQVAASVWGSPKFVTTWRSTDNALESTAAAHSDGLLVLDEIGQCASHVIGETVYMLGNGEGKARANDKGGSGRAVHEWRLLFLSTGEKTLAQHMAEANKDLKAGMDIRMLAIPADAGANNGMFEDLHHLTDAAELADTLKANVTRYYGTPIVNFLDKITAETRPDFLVLLKRLVDEAARKMLPAGAGGQAQRAAGRFAVAGIAGELATGYGITGWPDGFATEAARQCFNAWLVARGGAGNMEADKIVNTLRLVVERYGESRFTRWDAVEPKVDDHTPRTIDRLGFKRTIEKSGYGLNASTHVTLYFLSEAWSTQVFKGHNINNVNKELMRRGILLAGNDGKSSQSVTLPGMGKKARAYIVDVDALMSDSNESEALAA